MQNYFEFYSLPVSFHPDQAAVKAKYYELSRTYHPDRYANADNTRKLEVLTLASQNNSAWKTLSNADATMAYILKLNGLLGEEEKYALPPAFLMEMMDLNEAISEYEMDPGNAQLRQQSVDVLEEQLAAWHTETDVLTASFDAGAHDEALLMKIKDMYFRKKYLLRIQERLNKHT